MKKDPTEFRERFAKWKAGEKVYEAGKISDQQYYDTMEHVAELNNAEWNKERKSEGSPELSVDEEFTRILNDNTYDYRSYYNKYPGGKGNAIDHWTDEFKTVYHPTFSVYSKYSGKKSLYNPEGVLGGRWDGEKYIPAWGQKLPKYGGGKGDIDFYDDVTKHIILKEGFLTAPKDIGDGKITIGSGLTQKKYIDQYKRNGNKWSLKENYIAVKDTARGFENSLRGILPEYDQYPAEMRKALIDIIYNIGEGGLKNSPKFLSAMKSRNWNEAKRQMDWDNSDPLFGNGARKRNAERAALFDAGLAHWSPASQIEQMMESVPRFVPPIIKTPDPILTDYSIRTLTNNSIPATINSRNNGDSPLYGGSDYSFRMPSLKEYIERNLMRPQW